MDTMISVSASGSIAADSSGLHLHNKMGPQLGDSLDHSDAYSSSSGSSLLLDIPQAGEEAGVLTEKPDRDGAHLAADSWKHVAVWATHDSAQAAVDTLWSAEQRLDLELQLQSAETQLVTSSSCCPLLCACFEASILTMLCPRGTAVDWPSQCRRRRGRRRGTRRRSC
jgi:hypothetical protein